METRLHAAVGFSEFVESLTKALEAKDYYTFGHSGRVAQFAWKIAHEMGLDEQQIDAVHIAGYLHDIGKIGVPEAFLNKPGRLTLEEFRVVQAHSVKGFQILDKIKNLHRIAMVVKHHHERYDGQGYPDGLKDEAIPLESRIIAVADALDAMTSSRPYRGKLTIGEAVEEVRRHIRNQFDPEVVRALELVCKKDLTFLQTVVSTGEELFDFHEVDSQELYLSRKL